MTQHGEPVGATSDAQQSEIAELLAARVALAPSGAPGLHGHDPGLGGLFRVARRHTGSGLPERERPLAGRGGVVGGWPATILLLVATYLYGAWRLTRLGGPSVREFQEGAPPPWQGQGRGF